MAKKKAAADTGEAQNPAQAFPVDFEQGVDDEETPAAEQAAPAPASRRERLLDAQQRDIERERREARKNKFASAWAGAASAWQEKKVLYGDVISVTTKELKDTASNKLGEAVFLNVRYDCLKISIPFQQIYRRYPIDMTTVDFDSTESVRKFVNRQKAMAMKLADATAIPFIIDYMDADKIDPDGDYIITASRAMALEVLEHRNYDPDKKGFVRITEGSFVEGDIISTSDYSIQANFGGVDTILQVWNLTYRYVENSAWIRKNYHVGDKINVQVQSITVAEDGIHNIVVSAKAHELAEAKGSTIPLEIGEQTVGVITNIAVSKQNPGQVRVYLWLESLDRPAFSNNVQPSSMGVYPQKGEKVRVKISSILENGLVRVKALQQHGAADLFGRY